MFPYLNILKQAWELTIKNPWTWVFGLFIGGIFSANFSLLGYSVSPPSSEQYIRFVDWWTAGLDWIGQNAAVFALVVGLGLLFFFVLLVLQGLSKAAVIWTACQLSGRKPKAPMEQVDFRTSLKCARSYFWRIIGLQLLITFVAFVLLILFLSPVSYLFVMGVYGRGAVLLLLGLAILVPAGIVLGFVHLFGPVFIVRYDQRIQEAAIQAFRLVRQKLRESIILAAFLVGLGLLLWLVIVFSLILFSIPIAFLVWFLVWTELPLAVLTVTVGAILVGIVYAIVVKAAFAVFHNIVWVLAVQEMVKPEELRDKLAAWAVEPSV